MPGPSMTDWPEESLGGEEGDEMAIKRDIHENCQTCGVRVAEMTAEGISHRPTVCECPKVPGPQTPPRTVPFHSANFVSADAKRKWVSRTVFLALEDDVWHEEVVIVKGQWYWLDETFGIGGKGCASMLAAQEAQQQYLEGP